MVAAVGPDETVLWVLADVRGNNQDPAPLLVNVKVTAQL